MRKPCRQDPISLRTIRILCVALIAVCPLWLWDTARALETHQDSHGHAYLEEGKREMQRRNYARAIRLLSAAIKDGVNAYQWRGEAYFMSGDKKKALDDINECIRLQPSHVSGLLLRGDVALSNGNAAAALNDYSAAVKLSPDSARARVSRGLASMALERYGTAVRDFERALELEPRKQDALTNLGLANMLCNRPRAARAAFTAALSQETDERWQGRIAEWLARLPPESDTAADRDLPAESADPDDEVSRIAQETVAGSPAGLDTRNNSVLPAPHASPQRIAAIPRRPALPRWKGAHLSGKWEATYRGVQITLDVSQTGTSLSGVLKVHGPFGKESTYHFTGTAGYDGSIRVAHHSGHAFEGRATDDGRLVGTLTTRFGTSFPIDFAPK